MERGSAYPAISLVCRDGRRPARFAAAQHDVKGQVEAMSAALTAIRQAGMRFMISELNAEKIQTTWPLIARGGMVVVLATAKT